MIIIGITGNPSAGKDTVADYLVVNKNFKKYGLSDFLREEMTKLGLPLDRENMNKYSIGVKLKHGNDYLCYGVLKKISGDTAVPSVRSTSEVNTFRRELGDKFILLTINAPIEKRYEWAKVRQREGDSISFELFKEQEDRERNNPNGVHEVDKVVEMADVVIENDGTKEDLYKKVDELIKGLNSN